MNRAKIAALFLISFLGTATVIYEIHNRRPARGVVVGSAPEPKPSSSRSAASATPIIPAEVSNTRRLDQYRGPAPNIPPNGWGRNPFLTTEEINKLNRPESPVVVETPAPKPPVEPPGLPNLEVTGIISGDQGSLAIVDGRVFRLGEKIGTETLKEVKDRGIVLEHEGQMRELPLKKLEDTAAAAPPKKETKP
jgi:hypothetical protein